MNIVIFTIVESPRITIVIFQPESPIPEDGFGIETKTAASSLIHRQYIFSHGLTLKAMIL